MPHTLAMQAPLFALSPSKAAEFCDQSLDAEDLLEMLDAGRPFTRKRLCAYLDIGESTLSGWLKEGRIPQMAKNAIVLLLTQQQLAGRLSHAQARDWKVVRNGNRYQIAEMSEDEHGEVIGRLIADNIGSADDARLAASGPRLQRLLDEVLNSSGMFEYVSDMTDNDAFMDDCEALKHKLQRELLFLADHAQWQQHKRATQQFLDDLSATTEKDGGAITQAPNQRQEGSI